MRIRISMLASSVAITTLCLLHLAPAAFASVDGDGHPGELTAVKAGFVGGPHRQATVTAQLASAPPTAPFTECPPVGNDSSCALLVDVTNGGITVYQDPTQGTYDGSDDTLVGVLNQSNQALGHLFLSSDTEIFAFDSDGICSGIYLIDPSCPFGVTGYEGPGTSFTEIMPSDMSGVVSFNPTIAPGGTAYFSLEEALDASSVISGGPSLTEQGGAPNRSEHRSTCSTGHPVNCASGDFWHEFTDAKIPGRGVPLEFTRTYSSMNAAADGPLGFGWSDSYDMSLSLDSETGAATVHEEGGSSVTFPSDGAGGFTTPVRVLATLQANEDGTFTFSRYADHIKYVFGPTGQLLREVDRNGDVTSLGYSGAQLTSVTDPSGRTLSFTYTGAHIRTITDPMGRTTTFGYDGNGDLVEAVDPMGRKWQFTYDGNHRMLSMTDPRGGTTTNVYDGQGRVTSQTDPLGRESTWAYEGEPASAEGGSTTFTDPRGDQTRYRFRALELLSVTHALGTFAEATTSYSYDPSTLGLATVTDPDGLVTRNRFDAHGNLIESRDPMGRTSFYSYGPMDELLTATDPRGTTTTYTYDAAGNLLRKETPLTETGEVATTTYAYEAEPGEVTTVTDPAGHSTRFGYDSAGDRTSVTDADGHETTYSYDADGELLSSVSPRGNEAGGDPARHRTAYAYDADGELTKETDPLGNTTEYGYDADGNQTSTTDALGHTTRQVYDADGEPTETIRPDGSVLKTRWNGAGDMVAQIDAAGHTTEYTYDAGDRLTSTTDPDGRTTSYSYDADGNKLTSTNPEGGSTYYSYDGDGELSEIYYSDGTSPVYEYYDEDGNRVYMSDGSGTSTYAYDSLNRLVRSTDGAGATTAYGYDLDGHLTSITYPNGHQVSRSYDPAGNLVSVGDWLGHTTTFGYDADSDLTSEQFPGGVSTSLGYDDAGRLGTIEDTQGGGPLAKFGYSRDALGQVTKETAENGEALVTDFTQNSLGQLTAAGEAAYGYDAADNPTAFGPETTQQFDPANQLMSVTGPGEAGLPTPASPPVGGGGSPTGGGNQQSNSPPTPLGGGRPPARFAPNVVPKQLHCRKGFKKKSVRGQARCVKVKKRKKHRRVGRGSDRHVLAAFWAPRFAAATSPPPAAESDAPSVGTSATLPVGTRHLGYDSRGDRTSEELPGSSTRTLRYDGADRLIEVDGNVSYRYDGDGLRTAKTVNGVTTDFTWNEAESVPELLEAGGTSYLYGPEGQPIEEISGSTATFLHLDQQGSVRLLTDESGNPTGRYDYSAWGAVTKHSGSATSQLQYDGQYTDEETGFQYLRNRYYDPATGQFLTVDPAAVATQSRYGYAGDSPLDYSDPTGLSLSPAGAAQDVVCSAVGLLPGVGPAADTAKTAGGFLCALPVASSTGSHATVHAPSKSDIAGDVSCTTFGFGVAAVGTPLAGAGAGLFCTVVTQDPGVLKYLPGGIPQNPFAPAPCPTGNSQPDKNSKRHWYDIFDYFA